MWQSLHLLSWARLGMVAHPLSPEKPGNVQFPLYPQGGAQHLVQEEQALHLFQKGVWQIPGNPREGQA